MIAFRNFRLALTACAFASISTFAVAQGNAVALFQSMDTAISETSDDPDVAAVIEGDPSVISAQVGFIDTRSLESADVLTMQLPGISGAYVTGDLDRTDRAKLNFTMYGDDNGDEVNIVVDGVDVVGTIYASNKTYRIVPLGEGRHALLEVDYSRLEDHPDGYDEDALPSFLPPGGIEALEDALEDSSESTQDGPEEYTIIVAYTEKARQQAGNINALIQQSIENTNRSYQNSGVATRVRLVHRYRTNYVESASARTDLDRFRGNHDGKMDEIHKKRAEHRADIAMLLVGSGSGCGIASAILANKSNAYAVTRQNCSAGNMTFAHEIGHLQGARHNPEQDGTLTPFAYGHGYCDDPGNWRTVMSYNTAGRCPSRKKYWSTPARNYDGVPNGDAPRRDNVRVLNATAPLIANFYSTQSDECQSGFTAVGTRVCISSNAAAPRTFANAQVYCRDRRARVADYGDLRYVFVRSALDPAYNPQGRWIGNFVDDDRVLCGNRQVSSDGDSDIGNFEGTCNRFNNREFWCAYDR